MPWAYEIAYAMKYTTVYGDLFYFTFCVSRKFYNPQDYFILRRNISFILLKYLQG